MACTVSTTGRHSWKSKGLDIIGKGDRAHLAERRQCCYCGSEATRAYRPIPQRAYYRVGECRGQ